MAGASRRRRRLDPGGHQLRPEVVAHHQRRRIVDGAAKVFAAQGYRRTSVADIVKGAAIARASFYESFGSKEDCFLAVYDLASEVSLQRVTAACEQAPSGFPDRVVAGIGALLEAIEADPELARACVVEGPVVGPAINSRFEKLIGDFAALLRSGRDDDGSAELPETVEETVVGGLYWFLYHALLEKRPRRIKRLQPQLVEFSLIPFVGAETASAAAG
jgi:AcrR family transcriptional regulator